VATKLTELTASEAARAIAEGEITSEALVTACLARIEAREADVRAWAHIDPELALDVARLADEARRDGRGTGPLHGVPIGIKDILDTADYPTEYGSPAFVGRRPEEDAVAVQALRAAGAIILGKTITTEFATMPPNVTRNPRDLGRTPGGSSSGSAAAVADGMVPAALGTQTGGSVLRPCSFCGIFGYKPTFGFIPRVGVLAQAPSLDTIGIHARSIEDLALLGDVLQLHDTRDAASIAQSRPRLRAIAGMDWPLAPTFAFVRSPAWADADASTHEAFGELVEVLGDQVVEVDLNLTIAEGLAAARTVHKVELAHHLGPVLDAKPALVSDRVKADIEEGRSRTATDYVAALNAREAFYRAVAPIFMNHGTILTPAAPGPAPAGLGQTGNPIFNAFWTYLGVPAVSLPLLEVDGLPMGVQLVGARRDDGRLLRTARLLARQLAATA
jgi:Asp-tRNA(Asn)/Glu-tRNA(Gln) amidotransferase A subunit family amidase